MVQNRLSTVFASFLTLACVGMVHLLWISPAHAATAGSGSLRIEQKDTDYLGIERLGSWGLATPKGVIEKDIKLYTDPDIDAGNYALTVTPPPGGVPRIDVLLDNTLVESFDSRTANGKLLSGSLLTFEIHYAFTNVGDVSVNSSPTGIPFELKGPAGTLEGVTPAVFAGRVYGTYTVYYKLPKECRTPPPISRKLENKGGGTDTRVHVGFSYDARCDALGTGSSSSSSSSSSRTSSSSSSSSSSASSTSSRRSTTQSPVRVLISPASAEVTAGGTARFNVVVLNRGNSTLKDLTVQARFDGSKLSVSNAKNNLLTWTISSLAPDQKWQQSFAGNVSNTIENGDLVTASVTVAGDDLSGVRSSQRSSNTQVGVLKKLPQTGAPLDLLVMMVIVVASFITLSLAGMQEIFGR